MAKYLLKASYNADGTRGLLKDGGSNRKAAVANLIDDMGGTLESFYFAFGDHDVFVIADLPNEIVAAAIGLKVGASGLVDVSTTALLTPGQVDAACDKQTMATYQAPGT